MRYLLFLAAFPLVAATTLQVVPADPAGACTDTTVVLVSQSSNTAFGCVAGLYAAGTMAYTVNPPVIVPDTLTVNLSEDAYAGDAQANITLDGKLLNAAPVTVTASHALLKSQAFVFQGVWGPLPHTLKVTFLNDKWAGTSSTDRNLYLDSAIYDKVIYPATGSMMSTNDAVSYTITSAPPIIVDPPGSASVSLGVYPVYQIPAVPSNAKDLKKDYGALGDGSDATSALRNALNAGGSIIIPSGTYVLSDTPTVKAGTRLFGQGSPVLKQANGKWISLNFSGSGFESYGIIYDGAGIGLADGASNVILAQNKFQNITNGSDGIHDDGTLGSNSIIDSNTFYNIGRGGMGAYVSKGVGWDTDGSGFFANGFGDNIRLTNNVIDYVTFDGLKGFFNQNGPASKNFVLAGNRATHVHRISFEFQDCSSNSNGCFSGTTGSANNPVFKNNYSADPWWGDQGHFAFSFPVDHSSHLQIINNTAIQNTVCCYANNQWMGYGIETSGNGDEVRGNVVAGSTKTQNSGNNPGWGNPIGFDNSNAGSAVNNVVCGGNSKISQGGVQGNGVIFPTNNTIQYDRIIQDCGMADADMNKSVIAINWLDNAHISVRSRLSIARVDFYLDSSLTPFSTQELADINTNFANDPSWLYTYTPQASVIPAGQHFVTAKVTDVLANTVSSTQTFTK